MRNLPYLEHGGGTKRQRDDDEEEGETKRPAKKQKTEETPEEKLKREQTELLWKFKDGLKGLAPKDLREICELNDQSSKGGKKKNQTSFFNFKNQVKYSKTLLLKTLNFSKINLFF